MKEWNILILFFHFFPLNWLFLRLWCQPYFMHRFLIYFAKNIWSNINVPCAGWLCRMGPPQPLYQSGRASAQNSHSKGPSVDFLFIIAHLTARMHAKEEGSLMGVLASNLGFGTKWQYELNHIIIPGNIFLSIKDTEYSLSSFSSET